MVNSRALNFTQTISTDFALGQNKVKTNFEKPTFCLFPHYYSLPLLMIIMVLILDGNSEDVVLA